MELANFLGDLSTIIWFLPIFRQYGGNYFKFFLVLALTDPLSVLLFHLKVNWHISYGLFSIILYFSLFSISDLRKNWIVNTILVIIFSALLFFSQNIGSLALIHFLILLVIVRRIAETFSSEGVIKVYLLVLASYEFSLLIRFIILITATTENVIYSFILLAFQLIIALFFTFVNENKPLLAIRLPFLEKSGM
ncbi:MAG: hypothetical protein HXY49_12400 [Ignavibacteriaceae bacterium]|nr:hypothetical protein [Ignavibacteriaceae bacterium]